MGNAPSSASASHHHRIRAWLIVGAGLLFLRLRGQQHRYGYQWPSLISLNERLRLYDPSTLITASFLSAYILNHLSLLTGFNAPIQSLTTEPDLHYSPSFSRARHFLTAFDAGVLSCLHIPVSSLRHTLTFILGVYYLFARGSAELKMHHFRSCISIQQIKECWEKGNTNPMLRWMNKLGRERICCDSHILSVTVPDENRDGDHERPTRQIECYLYYDREKKYLSEETRLIFDCPGGGFIAMSPLHHADYLCYWAKKLQVPIIAVNYRKAPTSPWPAGLNDCYDVYKAIIQSEGHCIGLNHERQRLRIAVVGDSSGGNLAAAITLKAIEESQTNSDTAPPEHD